MFWPLLETVVTQPKQGKWNLDISWLRTCVPFAVHRTVLFYHNAVRAFRTGELETLYHFLKLSFSQNEFSVFKTGRFIILSNYRFVATRLYRHLEGKISIDCRVGRNWRYPREIHRRLTESEDSPHGSERETGNPRAYHLACKSWSCHFALGSDFRQFFSWKWWIPQWQSLRVTANRERSWIWTETIQ